MVHISTILLSTTIVLKQLVAAWGWLITEVWRSSQLEVGGGAIFFRMSNGCIR